jgi:hypothetical protein
MSLLECIPTGGPPSKRGPRKPCLKTANVSRAVKGLVDAGLPIVRVDVRPDGSFSIITATDDEPKKQSSGGFEKWD